MNKVILIGNLGKDPTLAYTASGMAVCNFSIATTEKWKDNSGKLCERTEWHNIAVYGPSAKPASENLRKGSQCFIEGRLETKSWEKDGRKNYRTEVIAAQVKWFHQGSKEESGEAQGKPAFGKAGVASITEDDLPF